jgi:ribosomal protein S18 acetylase RimI-like enzyme
VTHGNIFQYIHKVTPNRKIMNPPHESLIIRPYMAADESAVIDLWQTCNLIVPWNDPRKDIETKMRVQPELFLVGIEDENIVSTVMIGYEGHRGWINYLGVSPSYRRRGIGTCMMKEAERILKKRGCPKINLQIRKKNTEVISFYESLGYSFDEVVSMGKRLIPHHK